MEFDPTLTRKLLLLFGLLGAAAIVVTVDARRHFGKSANETLNTVSLITGVLDGGAYLAVIFGYFIKDM